MKLDAEIITVDSTYPATVHRLSYTSALVAGPLLAIGSTIALQIRYRGKVAVTKGQVRCVDPAVLSTLGIDRAVQVLFREPIHEMDVRFAEMVDVTLEDERLAPETLRPTRRCNDRLLSALTTAMNQINAASTSKTAFAGDLVQLSVALLFSLVSGGRKTGRLELEHVHDVVTIEFVNGRITNAYGTRTHETARQIAHVVLDWNYGTFRFVAGPIRGDAVVDLSVTALLLDHTRWKERSSDVA